MSNETCAVATSPARRIATHGFALSALAVTAGVALHLPMLASARHDGYRLRGMPVDGWMLAGTALIVLGLALAVAGLLSSGTRTGRAVTSTQVAVLDDVPLGRAHYGLIAALTLAIAVDSQKPFTFAFILPGVAREYGLSTPAHHVPGHLSVALLPFAGILGTVIGSLLWGLLADRYGRRRTILLAALIFIATATCSAMPSFLANVGMCFVMGLGAGGLLPIAYALLTETIPARRRGPLVVLVAGLGTAMGFLAASGLSDWLMPHFGWRVMWFVGLPTGLLLVLLNRFIPESPRFLLATNQVEEADVVMRRFGVRVVESAENVGGAPGRKPLPGRTALGPITVALSVYGLGWGVVNFGFLTWLPTDLAGTGRSAAQVSTILTHAALFSLPGAAAVAWLYGWWSSRGTMVLVGLLTAASLTSFAIVGPAIADHRRVFTALLVGLLVSLWGMIAVLAPYGAEVYPTHLRARGAGLLAGATKLGGVLALGLVLSGVAPPGLTGAAVFSAVLIAAGGAGILMLGVETRRRRLEEISAGSGNRTLVSR